MKLPEGPDWASDAAAAWVAARTFVARSAVFIVPGKARERAQAVGSATLLRTGSGKLALLTAAHCVEDAQAVQYRLGMPDHLDADDVVHHVHTHPDGDVDVAVVELKDGISESIAERALESTLIAQPEEPEVGERHWYILTGYPSQFHFDRYGRYPDGKPFRVQFFPPLVFGCDVTGLDQRGRICIRWDQAVADTSAETFKRTVEMMGDLPHLPEPNGVSGGAVWRFVPLQPGQLLWSPGQNGRIIAIPCSWDQCETQFAAGSRTWAGWFHELMSRI